MFLKYFSALCSFSFLSGSPVIGILNLLLLPHRSLKSSSSTTSYRGGAGSPASQSVMVIGWLGYLVRAVQVSPQWLSVLPSHPLPVLSPWGASFSWSFIVCDSTQLLMVPDYRIYSGAHLGYIEIILEILKSLVFILISTFQSPPVFASFS